MKKIIAITGKEMEWFHSMLPSGLLQSNQLIYGCLEDDKPCGCGIVDLCGHSYTLTWIYVAKEYRDQGCGNLLLDQICNTVFNNHALQLEVCFSPEQEWSSALSAMLTKRGAQLRLKSFPCFSVNEQELRTAPLFKGADPANIKAPNIVPFNQITAIQLRELKRQCSQNGEFIVSHADYTRADPRRSMALLLKNEIHGLTAVRTLPDDGQLNLDIFYLDHPYYTYGLSILRKTAAAILEHPDGFTSLRFFCPGEIALNLGLKLLGEQYQSTVRLITGSISQPLYRIIRSLS